MILSRRWLEALLGRSLDATQVEQLLTAHCCPVEGIEPIHGDLAEVLIARVIEVKAHPNADRLRLCLVDTGGADGPLEVVCGASNVEAGKRYPFAPVGATLPGGVKLERRKIRGIASNGMLCSARELGLGQDHEGILELQTDAAPGTRFLDAVPIGDDRILLEVYANRPDLLCHKGVARELAAALGGTVKLPAFPGAPADPSAYPPIRRSDLRGMVDGVEVRLEDPEGAPRYMIAVIRGVRVGPSP
ncbi:MAG TPA: phenylalanine--tRNA ligase subunit beta, partial [Methylomirabilota bacterium]|nr:phenylalanine--tRNA ligase subunit beta [Methylomirabilota bacterium]